MNRDEKISTIIELCKDIDGCTLGYILRSIGMEEQMLRQLVMRYPQSDIMDLLIEKVEVDDKRLGLVNN
jgi:hypothetical protein